MASPDQAEALTRAGESPALRDVPRRADDSSAAGADWRNGGFGVYVHWPFCLAKCPYCDFNSHVSRNVDQNAWCEALLCETAHMHDLTGSRTADTVFFGGGTPSLMPPQTVAAIVERIDRLWGLAPDAEITLEANPTSVEAAKFRDYASSGVNRVSMGVQALNDADLKALGRMHSVVEAQAAFDIARSVFDRVSFDLIYARVGQTTAAWEAELGAALDMAVDHLSLYQLTIEPGTRFAELYSAGKLHPPADAVSAEMYELTQSVTEAAGMPAYEISNHARPGAESRHNRVYWRYGDYAGIGPGAHGRLTLSNGARYATETLRDPAGWLDAVGERGHAVSDQVSLPRADQATEYALMSLRLREGMSSSRYEALAGRELPSAKVDALVASDHLRVDGDRVSASADGRIVLNTLLAQLLAEA
jgi:oxygen-independent coproporphyrinogen-3 oxidase